MRGENGRFLPFFSHVRSIRIMTTYLLTWNPSHWAWTSLHDNINDIKKKGFHADTWSCGVTKKIVPGDRVFLMKLGKETPRGIVASGWATSRFFEDKHWNDKHALTGKLALYINVHLDTILDPEKRIFPKQQLDNGIYAKMNWQPQASGRSIPDEIAAQLEIDWANFTGQLLPLPEGDTPEEIGLAETYMEGATKKIVVNVYERSAEARTICIKYYGLNCVVCGFDFEKVYGRLGKNYIHVHHLKPISEVGEEYELNPLTDLRPVCPNCHAMLHKRKPAYKIEELQKIMRQI